MTKQKILLVSDSLGTPIHARGIFNFTVGLVEILRRLDCEVHLLVEPPSIGSFPTTERSQSQGDHDAGLNRVLFSDLVRHFEGDRFRFDWRYPDDSVQRMAEQNPSIMDVKLALDDVESMARQFSFSIVEDELHEYSLGSYSRHLGLFHGFVSYPRAYSESFRRGGHGLRPVSIKAEGYDHVIVDTPHHMTFAGIARDKVHYVVHDFIPFFDRSMGFDWRQLFASKISTTVATGGNAIFNSETTGRYFRQIYPSNVIDRHVTIYPPIREEVAAAAINADRSKPSRYMRAIKGNKRKESRQWQRAAAQNSKFRKLGPLAKYFVKSPEWNPDLPFYCTVLSDEPRKNVQAMVDVSKEFVNELNFIVIGQIDGNRYMGQKPYKFPNLHFTGYISDEQKLDLIRACEGFIFPSLSEGFGIPIVEAATLKAPVICTDIEVFREITFEKASYFDPFKQGDLARAVRGMRADADRDRKADELKALVDKAFMQDVMEDRMRYLLEGDRK